MSDTDSDADDLTAGSETEYQDSLTSLTQSMAAQLFTTSPSGARYSALSPDYLQSYDEPDKHAERLLAREVAALAGAETKLWWEPEGMEGHVDELLGSGRIVEPRVLDVGCGIAGVWISDIGSSYPRAEVYGLDIAPVEADLPPNVSAEVFDVLEGLPFPNAWFTVVHIRVLMFWIAKDFHTLLNEVVRVLAPGGVLLLEESDVDIRDANGDMTTFSWSHLVDPNEVRLAQIVLKNLPSTLRSLSDDPYAPNSSAFQLQPAFNVYEREWVIHVGWKDGEKGQPSSPEIGNHMVCPIVKEIYTLYFTNTRLPPREVEGEPTMKELWAQEVLRCLEAGQEGMYNYYSTFFAVRRGSGWG